MFRKVIGSTEGEYAHYLRVCTVYRVVFVDVNVLQKYQSFVEDV